MEKVVVLKKSASAKMPDVLKKIVNEAFDGAETEEDKEVADTINEDIKKAREMINEIEEELEEMDEKELSKPNQDYVDNLMMSLSQYIFKEEENEKEEGE